MVLKAFADLKENVFCIEFDNENNNNNNNDKKIYK